MILKIIFYFIICLIHNNFIYFINNKIAKLNSNFEYILLTFQYKIYYFILI